MSQHVVSAAFDSREEAQRAIEELRSAGASESAVSIIGRNGEDTGANDADKDHASFFRGILGGGALGAGLGVAALAIPGVGPLTALGAIAASAVPGALGIGAAAGAAA